MVDLVKIRIFALTFKRYSMTINEHQELEILQIMIEEKITKFDDDPLPPKLYAKIGNGFSEILRAMTRDGFLNSYPGGKRTIYHVTPLAHNRYRLLMEKLASEQSGNKMNIWILTVGIIAAVAAILSAYYGYMTYYHPLPPPPEIKVISAPLSPKKDTTVIKTRPDSMK